MAKIYEMRGHVLYRKYVDNQKVDDPNLRHFDEWVFLFSLGRRDRETTMMHYYLFFETLSPEKELEMTASEIESDGRLKPGILVVARGESGHTIRYESPKDVDFSDLIDNTGAKAKLSVSGGGKYPVFAKLDTIAGGLIRDFRFQMRDTDVWNIADRLSKGIWGKLAESGAGRKIKDPWKVT